MLVCRFCQKEFSSMRNLTRHVEAIHYPTNQSCENCCKTFKCLTYLRNHQLRRKCQSHGIPNLTQHHTSYPRANSRCVIDLEPQAGAGLRNLQSLSETESNGHDDAVGVDEYEPQTGVGLENSQPLSETESIDQDDSAADEEHEPPTDQDSVEDNYYSEQSEGSSDDTDSDDHSDCTEDFIGNLSDVTDDDSLEDDINHGEEGGEEFEEGFLYRFGAYWHREDKGYLLSWISRTDLPSTFEHRKWLVKLLNPSDRIRKRLIRKATHSQLEAFREIAYNLLDGRTPMTGRMLKASSEDAHLLRTLASISTNYPDLRTVLLEADDPFIPCLLLHAKPDHILSDKTLSEMKNRLD